MRPDIFKHLIESGADMAIVVGGYNSSNTSHLVELCEEEMPTYYIKDHDEMLSSDSIRHFDLHRKEVITSSNWLPESSAQELTVALTSGASCPDKTVDDVLACLVGFFPDLSSIDEALSDWDHSMSQNAHSA